MRAVVVSRVATRTERIVHDGTHVYECCFRLLIFLPYKIPPPSCVWELPWEVSVRAFCAPVPLQLVVKGNLLHVPILFNICSITVLFLIELLDLVSLSEEFVHCHGAMDGKWFSLFFAKIMFFRES